MKQKIARPYSYGLKIFTVSSVIILVAFISMSFRMGSISDDLWKTLGITQLKGAEKIKSSFMYGYLDYYGVKNIKALANGDRSVITRDLLNYTKTYLNSAEVKAAYAEERGAAKPAAPELAKFTKEQIRDREVANLKKSIGEVEQLLKEYPEMEKTMRPSINELNKTIKEYMAPGSKLVDIMHMGQVEDNKYKERQYAEDLEKWEADYPSDHRIKLRNHLQKYLSIANTVDFNATLIEKRGKMIFEKSEYEGKDHEWKMIFRAGKEVYQVAKPFAEQWLKELPAQ